MRGLPRAVHEDPTLIQQYTLDQSPSVHESFDATAAPPDAQRPMPTAERAAAACAPTGREALPALRTVCIQFLRARNLGALGGELLEVPVTRGDDGTLGIGLNGDDGIVEVTNVQQVNLQVNDQIRAVDGIALRDGNIISAMVQVPRERHTFAVELVRWPKGVLDGFWRAADAEHWIEGEVLATTRGSSGDAAESEARTRALSNFMTPPELRRSTPLRTQLVVTLSSADRHRLVLKLMRETFFLSEEAVGGVTVCLDDLGPCEAPHAEWLMLRSPGTRGVVGEVLVRVSRCDWAMRLDKSPDATHAPRRPKWAAEPLHAAQPIARIVDTGATLGAELGGLPGRITADG
jgi:hypothetical protein